MLVCIVDHQYGEFRQCSETFIEILLQLRAAVRWLGGVAFVPSVCATFAITMMRIGPCDAHGSQRNGMACGSVP